MAVIDILATANHAALKRAIPVGHHPVWEHAQEAGAFSLRCTGAGCAWEVRPRVTYLAAEGTVRTGGDLGPLLEPHLEEFVRWHAEARP